MGIIWLIKIALIKMSVENYISNNASLFSTDIAASYADAVLKYISGALHNADEFMAVSKRVEDAIACDRVCKKFDEQRQEATTFNRSEQFAERDQRLQPYRNIFSGLDTPQITKCFMHDRIFARLRVAGYNPTSLHRLDTEQLPFDIQPDRMPFPGDTIEKAIAEKRFYYVCYRSLLNIKQRTDLPQQKMYATQSIFAIPPGGGELAPVAIKVWRSKDDAEVAYPMRDGDTLSTRWAIAKLAVNQNDATHHELVAHLGRTHFFMERFIAATHRQLPPRHPIYRLLIAHFEGTCFINTMADADLISEAGDVTTVFAGDREHVLQWTMEEVNRLNFNDMMPDEELKKRGLQIEFDEDDASQQQPLIAPYRDDALRHFKAMVEWAGEYLDIYYKKDSDLGKDHRLQLWIEELIHPQLGNTRGFGDHGDGKVHTKAYLARALSLIMFTASVQHAAVNFPQKAYMSYAPAVAGALYKDPPKEVEKSDVNRWLLMLTPSNIALAQVRVLHVIGELKHTGLGEYPKVEWKAWGALIRYRAKLRRIGKSIAQREREEEQIWGDAGLKYEFLHPNNVPRSINI